MKKLFALILALSMVLALASCAIAPCRHTDADEDGICDLCKQEIETVCSTHNDEDGDGICDDCGQDMPCEHADAENDGVCDKCGATIERTPPALTGLVLTSAIIDQLEAAASFEIELAVENREESSYYK